MKICYKLKFDEKPNYKGLIDLIENYYMILFYMHFNILVNSEDALKIYFKIDATLVFLSQLLPVGLK